MAQNNIKVTVVNVETETLENSMAKLTIEVAAEDFVAATVRAYNRNKKNINVQGFRKGKAPQAIIEKLYGAGIFYEEAADDVIQHSYTEASSNSGLDITSYPKLDLVQCEKGKSFIYTAEVALRPAVELGQYKGVEIEKIDTEVTEEEVEAELKKAQDQNARVLTTEEAAKDGDTVVLDYAGTVDGVAFDGGTAEGQELVLGSGTFIPGFEEQLVGKKAGEEVDVNVTFPEDYHADDLAGKAAVFACKINEVKTKELPELNDEFAQDISDFETLEEYKEDTKKRLADRKAADYKSEKQERVMEIVVPAAKIEIPAPMIDKSVDDMLNQYAQQLQSQGLSMDIYMEYTNTTPQQLAEQARPQAERNIRSRLVLDAIAEAEGIVITDEDIDAEIARLAEQWEMGVDEVKKYMDPEEMRPDMRAQKALDLIVDAAVEK